MLIKLTDEQNQELQARHKEAVDKALEYKQLANINPNLRSYYDDLFWDKWGQATAYFLLGQFELDLRLKELIYGQQ
jgi:hypothetical protein